LTRGPDRSQKIDFQDISAALRWRESSGRTGKIRRFPLFRRAIGRSRLRWNQPSAQWAMPDFGMIAIQD